MVLKVISHKIAFAVGTVAFVLILNFMLLHSMPGDPLAGLVGEYPAPPEYIAQLRQEYGLDKGLPEQLLAYVTNVLSGNLGYSFANNAPVLELLVGRAGKTLVLVVPALLIASFLAVSLSLYAAPRAGRPIDLVLTAVVLFGYSVPIFWFAQICIIIFSVWLGWLPAQGMMSLRGKGAGGAIDILLHFILPLTSLILFYLALVGRVARTKMIEVLNDDYVTTAIAKGLPFRSVLWRHILPNSLIPIITVIGYTFSYSLTGAILVEAAFGWPGLGTLFLNSISTRDYPVLLGILLASTVLVVTTNIVTDVIYTLVDPRVSIERGLRDA